jgi:hypothetical protein
MVMVTNVDATAEQAVVTHFNTFDTTNMKPIGCGKPFPNSNGWLEALASEAADRLDPSMAINVCPRSDVDMPRSNDAAARSEISSDPAQKPCVEAPSELLVKQTKKY